MAEKMAKAMVSAEPPVLPMRATMEMPAVVVPPPPEVSPPPPRSLPHDEPLTSVAASDPEPPGMLRTREARPSSPLAPSHPPSRPAEDAEIEVMSEEDEVPPDAEEVPLEASPAPRPTFKPPSPPEPLAADWGAQFGIDTPPGAEEMPVLEGTAVVEATVEEVVEVEQGLPVASGEEPQWGVGEAPPEGALSESQLPSWVTQPVPANGNGHGEGPDPTGGWAAVPPSDDVLMPPTAAPAEALEPTSSPPGYGSDPNAEMVVTAGDPFSSTPVVPVSELDFSSANPEDPGAAAAPAPEAYAQPEFPGEATYVPQPAEVAPAFSGEDTYVPTGEEPPADPFEGHGVEIPSTVEVSPEASEAPQVAGDTASADAAVAVAQQDSVVVQVPVEQSGDEEPLPMASAPRPGFAPVEVPRLVDLGPTLDYGQASKVGPFHVGEEGLALSVEGELLSRLSGMVAVVGTVEVQPERRRFRGRPSEEPFGEGGEQMQRLTGQGVVYLEPSGAAFQAIDLDDEGVYLREERIFAFEEDVAFENGKLTGENVSVPLVHLKGHGRVLLKLDGPLKAIAVPPGSPLKVPLARLVGWYGHVSPRVIGFVGRPALELTGDGYALLARG